MYQEEILKAIKEQTSAMNRQTDVIEKLIGSFERLSQNAVLAVPAAGRRPIERGIPANRTPAQIKADNKRILAEAKEKMKCKQKN